MEDLNEIAIYARVVERKSFSAAAKELHLSPSVVSKRVTALEERLGVQLLNRSTRRLSLTEAGNQFYLRCAKALSEIATASGEASAYSNQLSGQIKVYSTIGVGLKTIGNGILGFCEKYPNLSVDMMVGIEPVNLIEHGIDLVIRSADLRDASIESRVLMPVSYHLVASPVYLKTHGMPATPTDLATHNCLVHTGRRNPNEWHFIGTNGPYSVRVSGHFAANSGATLLWAAQRGLGITLLPGYTVAEHIAAGELVSLFDKEMHSSRCIRGFYTRTRYPQPKVQLLLDFLTDYIKAARPREAASNAA